MDQAESYRGQYYSPYYLLEILFTSILWDIFLWVCLERLTCKAVDDLMGIFFIPPTA